MFFKTSHPDVLTAWDQYVSDCQKLHSEARKLEQVLGCGARALFCTSVDERRFKGICFSASARPFAPELWTVQRAVTGWSCEPRRSRIPKALRAQAAELAALWAENVPRTCADFSPGLNAMGLDFSVTLFGSFTRFRLGDVVYIETGMKPAAHMTEILSEEYLAARKQAEASS
ncbi:hypothetical protein KMG33_004427 [Salmonella enterica]|nr:hypothetical protein [Salmonella enterica]ECH9713620.1 hypothetical protein [Salmonella enterica subsp. enterica serovar Javiana]EEF1216664.1 hypothetical protein [Salmonella enterica]EEP4965328.1 hypothetical protein [Salmonella enterica]EGZ4423139.1 hypothetical protein [Salmonella enterica subsp. enterica serovar Javiana]